LLRLQNIPDIRVIALPLAFSLSNIFQLAILLLILCRRWKESFLKNISFSFLRTLVASLIMAFFVYTTLYYVADWVDMERTVGVLLQLVAALSMGLISYVVASFKLNRKELTEMVGALSHKFRK